MKNAENVSAARKEIARNAKGYVGAQSAVQPGSGETAGRTKA